MDDRLLMNPCWARALWIASATAPTSSSSRASPTANEPRRDQHLQLRRKPAGKRRPELWETSRKCSHGHGNEFFFELRAGNGAVLGNSGQRPVASARTAVKEQSPLRGAPLVPRSGFCPSMGRRALPPLYRTTR
jgi:hypothetical protein